MAEKAFLARFAKRMMWMAQDGKCPLCGQGLNRKFGSPQLTFDHVWPKGRVGTAGSMEGNYLLAHEKCNRAKAMRRPNGCERLWLFVVNRRLGLPAHETHHWDRP